MKKIIAAFDCLRFSESTLEYSIFLSQQESAHLVGVFLDDFTRRGYNAYETVVKRGTPVEKLKELDKTDQETKQLSIEKFEKACQHSGINHTVHHDFNFPIRDLLHESVFADMMIINYNETFSNNTEPLPTHFITELLSNVQCPVLLVPNKFKPIEKLVLLYDGKPSSVFAIKMISYLLPSLKTLDTKVITVKSRKESLHVPDGRLAKEFMKRHFPHAKYTVLTGLPEAEIVLNLERDEEITLVTCGAYGRNPVSMFFNQSMADVLISEVKAPLFIAHYK